MSDTLIEKLTAAMNGNTSSLSDGHMDRGIRKAIRIVKEHEAQINTSDTEEGRAYIEIKTSKYVAGGSSPFTSDAKILDDAYDAAKNVIKGHQTKAINNSGMQIAPQYTQPTGELINPHIRSYVHDKSVATFGQFSIADQSTKASGHIVDADEMIELVAAAIKENLDNYCLSSLSTKEIRYK